MTIIVVVVDRRSTPRGKMSKEEEDDKNATSVPPTGRAVAATVAALHDRYRMDAIIKSWWVGGLNIYVTRLLF
jgi:hypothetical protein